MQFIGIIIGLAALGFGIYTAVDAGKYPDEAFRAVGTSKSTWQIWPIVGGVLCGIVAIVMGAIWFSSKKAEVERAAAGGGGFGAPPTDGGWTPPPPQGPPQ